MARKHFFTWVSLTGTLFFSVPLWPTTAYAGVYSDALSKCLVSAVTEKDKLQLVEWVFFNLSLNPSLASYSKITPEQREKVNKNLARIFERLLAESCPNQAKQALKYEGENSFAQSFGALGEVASLTIYNHPAVIAGISTFTQYLDIEKIKVLFPEPSREK